MPALVVMKDGKTLQVFDLQRERIVVGRKGPAAPDRIVLDDPTVSTDHARLERHGALYMVEDLNSRNGVMLNGQVLPPNRLYPLHPGDRMQICDFILEMAAQAAQAQAAPEAAPEPFPSAFAGFELRKIYAPRDVVGGDFFVSRTLDANRLAVAVGDATEAAKGAEITPRCAEAARRLAVPDAAPRDVVAAFQRSLAELQAGGRVTFLYGVLDGRDASFRYVNAGQVSPVLYNRAKPDQIRKLLSRGEPLSGGPAPTLEEKKVALEVGEVMILLTDGILDAFPRTGADETTLKNGIRESLVASWHLDFKGFVEAVKRKIAESERAAAPFGYEGIAAAVAAHGASGVRTLLPALQEAVSRHVGGEDIGDDLTLIGFERTR